jgi:colicin import membrane protein
VVIGAHPPQIQQVRADGARLAARRPASSSWQGAVDVVSNEAAQQARVTCSRGDVEAGSLSTGLPEKRSVVITSVQLYVMSEPTETERRICRFPGCQRPAAASQAGAGRPPEYCDNTGHNRTAAWHARRRLRTEQSGHAAGVEQRPVDAARQRASELHGQVAGMVEHLGQQLQGLLEELRTVADPEAAELQIEAVTSQAAEQVATAEARASRAEQAQRRVEAERAEADAAAEEASALSEQLRAGLDESGQRLAEANAERDRVIAELADARATLEAEREQSSARLVDLAEQLTTTEARMVEAHAGRDAATQRAEAALVSKSEAEERSRNAVERVEAESARAARAEDAVESLRRDLVQAERRATDLREELGDLRGKLATMTAQRDAAVYDAEREKVHGQQRVDDLRARHKEEDRRLREEFVELRGELNAAREEASVQRSRADRAEARLDSAPVARETRRPQSPPGRGRRRGESTAPGVDETGG